MSAPAAADPPMIRMVGVHKHFGSLHVLRDINLEVARGEVVVVLGPYGSGQAQLCRSINRLEPIDEGSIEIDGIPLPEEGRALARLRADVGMVFQQFNLFAHKTIAENVELAPVRVRRISKPEAHEAAMQLLTRVGIRDQADKYPAQLSGGQQQRAAIARALAMRPKVMLFDEPTSALDPELVGEVLRAIRAIAEERRTMLLVTHEMKFARDVANRVLFLHQGQVEEDGPPEQVFENPRSERCRQFISSRLGG